MADPIETIRAAGEAAVGKNPQVITSGDVVRLRGGHEIMTVSYRHQGEEIIFRCHWHLNGELRWSDFRPYEIEHVPHSELALWRKDVRDRQNAAVQNTSADRWAKGAQVIAAIGAAVAAIASVFGAWQLRELKSAIEQYIDQRPPQSQDVDSRR